MLSHFTKQNVLKHLTEGPLEYSVIVEKVKIDVGGSAWFAERAVNGMIDSGEIVKSPGEGRVPTYQPPGAAEGKYAGFNNRRLRG